MERLGMRFDGTFEHPNVPIGHRLRTHLLYRLPRPDVEE
jgi:RimJ/RimL family protein N-acetyltransferase